MIEAIVGILYAQVKIAQYNRSLHAQHTYWIGKHFTQKKVEGVNRRIFSL